MERTAPSWTGSRKEGIPKLVDMRGLPEAEGTLSRSAESILDLEARTKERKKKITSRGSRHEKIRRKGGPEPGEEGLDKIGREHHMSSNGSRARKICFR